jgi:drug/metabolite transporter, DME family
MTITTPSTQPISERPRHRVGWALVLVAATLWGTTGLAFKALGANPDNNAWAISFMRLALSVPFILVCARLLLGRWLPALTLKGLLVLLAVGAGMALYQITYVLAIERVGVAIAVLISICGAPVLVALIAVPLFKERLTKKTYLSLLTALVGTVLLVGWPEQGVDALPRFWEGVAIAVACAVFQAFFVLAAREAGKVCHPMHSVGVGFSFGALMLLPFALHFGLTLQYSGNEWLILLYLGAIPTALAQSLFLTGIKSTGAVGGAIASLLEPLVSTVLAVWLLGEQLGPIGYVGALILLIGILIS